MFQALRIRDFRWLWTGGVVSALGSWMLVLAVPAHVYEVTGSLARTGLTLAAEYLPLLLLGPAAPPSASSSAGTSEMASCMPSAAASWLSAATVGLPRPFSRLAM